MKKLELLAPAGNFSKLKTALYFGADAVYLGGKQFSLRAFSDNFTNEELSEAIKYVHEKGKKAYITVNIFAKNSDFEGICFVNLVEFDSEYGHRRNAAGYGKALEDFDAQLAELVSNLNDDDLLIVTADHGNDPSWVGTDHTREKVPLLIYSPSFTKGKCLPERNSFADIGATILHNFSIEKPANLLGTPINELFED